MLVGHYGRIDDGIHVVVGKESGDPDDVLEIARQAFEELCATRIEVSVERRLFGLVRRPLLAAVVSYESCSIQEATTWIAVAAREIAERRGQTLRIRHWS